jgi:Ribosomal protein L4/L1 family.
LVLRTIETITKSKQKQKELALNFALAELVSNEKIFVMDNIVIESGKTKDARHLLKSLVKEMFWLLKS